LTDQEKEALAGAGAVMHLYFDRLNARDEAGIRERAFHFPHARFHGNGITVLARPEDFKFADFLGRSDNSGWHHSTWDYYEPIDVAPTKVHYRVSSPGGARTAPASAASARSIPASSRTGAGASRADRAGPPEPLRRLPGLRPIAAASTSISHSDCPPLPRTLAWKPKRRARRCSKNCHRGMET